MRGGGGGKGGGEETFGMTLKRVSIAATNSSSPFPVRKEMV